MSAACHKRPRSPAEKRLVEIGEVLNTARELVSILEIADLQGTIAWDRAGSLREGLGALFVSAASERAQATRENSAAAGTYAAGYYACLQDLGIVPRGKR